MKIFVTVAATLQYLATNGVFHVGATALNDTTNLHQKKRSRRNLKTGKKSSGKGGSSSNAFKIQVVPPPPLPGVSQNGKKVILAQDIDYPPYTSIGADLDVSGFGPDFARGLSTVCDIDVVLVQTQWSECWGNNKIGSGLSAGHFHGCTTYTNTKGVRNRYLEFTAPIVDMNKAAGILTRLENGKPVVTGSSSLNDVKVADVVGWAPTADVLATVKNQCTGETFSGFTYVDGGDVYDNENDEALKILLDGRADAVWIYADQAINYKSACDTNPFQEWDCSLWSRFGIDFAYIQTGIYDYMNSGTTLAMTKKGSGLSDTLNPCISAFIETPMYAYLCSKYDLVDQCFQNQFFDNGANKDAPYSKPTRELTTSCSDGYCPCP